MRDKLRDLYNRAVRGVVDHPKRTVVIIIVLVVISVVI